LCTSCSLWFERRAKRVTPVQEFNLSHYLPHLHHYNPLYLEMEKTCSKCGLIFNCGNELRGCWCEEVHLDQETLDLLKENYANCLCPTCLKNFEHPAPVKQSSSVS
jgi:hypothetical protein